jgi:hypothetical protein
MNDNLQNETKEKIKEKHKSESNVIICVYII